MTLTILPEILIPQLYITIGTVDGQIKLGQK
jgi:hypothetical protein